MSERPAGFRFYVVDWITSRNVRRMNGEERGAYIEVLIECWETGYVVASDDELATLWPWTKDESERRRLWAKVSRCMLPHEMIPNAYYNRRLEEERIRVRDIRRRLRLMREAPWDCYRGDVYRRDGASCVYCGAGADLTIDHIIPQSAGGDHDPGNLVTACRPCNSSKGARRLPAEREAALLRYARGEN